MLSHLTEAKGKKPKIYFPFYYNPFISKLFCISQYLLSLVHSYYLIPCNTQLYPHFNETALSINKQKSCLHITFNGQL